MENWSIFSNIPVLWMIFAIVMGIIEILTVTFGFFMIGGSAVVAAILASLHLSFTVQVIVFAACCILSMLLIRPRLINTLHSAKGVPGRTGALVGKIGRVTDPVNVESGAGRVLVEGQDWAARSSQNIPSGTQVKITGADGIVLLVDLV